MNTFFNDLKYSIRMLAKKPRFTAVIMVILAIGIGANTALFSVIQSVLLSPLPFHEPDRLVFVRTESESSGRKQACSGPDYLDWIEQNSVFDSLCAISTPQFTLTNAGDPATVEGFSVTHGFVKTIGAKMQLGRDFTRDEFHHDDQRVVILSHKLWQARFGADPNILKREILLDGVPWQVVGVAQPTMGFLEDFVQFFVPQNAVNSNDRDHRYLTVFARLKSGVSLTQAQAEMDLISVRLSRAYSETNKHMRAVLYPLHGMLVSAVRTAFLILYGAVALVLVIACVNISNLLLARSTARQREIAVRNALGAGRPRIIRQMLTESVLLALGGGALGLVLGWWGLDGLRLIAPEAVQSSGGHIPGFDELALNLPVLVFTLGVSVLTGVLFGLVPAFKGSHLRISEVLKQGGELVSQGRRHHRIQSLLVVAQIAGAVMLLSGAGLLVRSYGQLQRTQLGFEPHQVLAIRIERPNLGPQSTHAARTTFFDTLVRHLKEQPGIESISASTEIPLTFNSRIGTFQIKGRPVIPGEPLTACSRTITPDYFRCLRIPVIRGRCFHPTDNDTSRTVVVVNEAFSDQYFSQENPIGKQLIRGENTVHIVGVVGNVKICGLQPQSFSPMMYKPLLQVGLNRGMTLLMRTTGNPRQWIQPIQQAIWNLYPDQPIERIQTMRDIAADTTSVERFCMILLIIMAGVAGFISVVGLYGIVAYTVNERQNEIGIRLALGATRADITKRLLTQGVRLFGLGVVFGLLGTVALSRLLKSLLHQVSPTDPVILVSVTILLFLVALVACTIPALHAAKIDPMVALRYE